MFLYMPCFAQNSSTVSPSCNMPFNNHFAHWTNFCYVFVMAVNPVVNLLQQLFPLMMQKRAILQLICSLVAVYQTHKPPAKPAHLCCTDAICSVDRHNVKVLSDTQAQRPAQG